MKKIVNHLEQEENEEEIVWNHHMKIEVNEEESEVSEEVREVSEEKTVWDH